MNARRADPLYSFASLAFGALTLAQTLFGLLFTPSFYVISRRFGSWTASVLRIT